MLEDFYPTPGPLISKMLEGIKFGELSSILEPSAGKGDICDRLRSRLDSTYNRRSNIIDTIEINPELQHILRGKDYNLIHDDFLTFKTQKPYDLILANFPFSRGADHLEKALTMLTTSGGRLVCLVNAETLRNQFNSQRQMIAKRLENLGASIEYLAGEFRDAERQTNVEVALIKVEAERLEATPLLLDDLKRAEEQEARSQSHEGIEERDFVAAMVGRFNLECKLGVRLLEEYHALRPYILDRHQQKGEKHDYRSPLIELNIKGASSYSARNVNGAINDYLPLVRQKYWELLVNDPRFIGQYTSNIVQDLQRKLIDLTSCDFNRFNIENLMKELQTRLAKGVEKAILDLFDRCSRAHAYDKTIHNGNVHYFNGWKTNKSWKVNQKIVLPEHGISAWSKSLTDSARQNLSDMTKVFNYLAVDRAAPRLLSGVENRIWSDGYRPGEVLDLRYFEVKFFKKGTCHIKFLDKDLLDKFNIFGSQRKGWLPPSYGKRNYEEMDREERSVVDDFQGKDAYEQVMKKPEFYLVEDALALLGDGSIHG